MTYNETIEYLYHSAPAFEKVGASAYKEGLENTLAIDRHFGHPHRKYKTIHVAGTNGKGTTAHSLASILMADGKKVGLYTSPHLVDFRERVRVDGEMMPEEYVVDFVEKNRDFFATLSPSFFEITTALAFSYFADAGVDVAVAEVGLGGRLDCTNIITPELCVITNISLDHTQFLGNTLAKIAGEKAGIIKAGVPVVVGEYTDETRPVFEQKAREMHSPLLFAQDSPEILSSMTDEEGHEAFSTKSFGQIQSDLSGSFQAKNVNTILNAASILIDKGLISRRESVGEGLSRVGQSTHLSGRWQTLSHHPRMIADTGHNPGAWTEIRKLLQADKHKTLRIVFGMVADKDIRTVASLLPTDAVYYACSPSTKRAMPTSELALIMREIGLKVIEFSTPIDAIQQAMESYTEGDLIFIGGSNYLLADILEKAESKLKIDILKK